jgi:hypothetical protein
MVISDKTTTSSLLDPALFAQIYFRNKDEEDIAAARWFSAF